MPPHIRTGKEARQQLIDPMIAGAGWQHRAFAVGSSAAGYHGCAVAGFPTPDPRPTHGSNGPI